VPALFAAAAAVHGLQGLAFTGSGRALGVDQRLPGRTPEGIRGGRGAAFGGVAGGARPRHLRSAGSAHGASQVARRIWESVDEFVRDPVVSVVGWSIVFASLTIIRVAVAEEEDTPKAFLEGTATGPPEGSEPRSPVVCLGDSLTRGNLSADWVAELRQRLTSGEESRKAVINAGVNMQCVKNVLNRLDEVIACRPSHVTVLVGTNDLKAMESSVEGWLYRVFGKIPKVPTIEEYERDLQEIRDRLLAAGACVALVSPPVLGEDINCVANQRAAAFAATVRNVALAGGERCTYLPLFEETSAKLPNNGGRPYDGMRFFWWLCLLCFDIHLLKRDLAEVQRERELGVTVDLVHLGPQAASSLVEMTESFVASFPSRATA